jgi:hypothetical protein
MNITDGINILLDLLETVKNNDPNSIEIIKNNIITILNYQAPIV